MSLMFTNAAAATAGVLVVLAAFAGTAQAAAVTVGFEGRVANTGTAPISSPYVEGGYTLAYTGTAPQIFGANYALPPGGPLAYNGNGSAVLGICSSDTPGCSANVLTFSYTQPFSLLSLQVGNLYRPIQDGTPGVIGETLDLLGTLADGSTVNASFGTSQTYITLNSVDDLSDFTNLISLTVSASAINYIAIDNLVFDTAAGPSTGVPEPLSLGLVSTALAALVATSGVTRRRRG